MTTHRTTQPTSPEPGPTPHAGPAPHHRGLSRRGLLRGTAIGAGGLAATALGAGPLAGPAAAAPTVTKIKNLAGTQCPVQFGVGATDLGIPARCPNGRVLYLFGDTWADRLGGSNWRSPVGLFSSTTDVAAGITFDGAVGASAANGNVAQQLWYYPHDSYYATVIPSDVITVGNTMYLQAIVNGPTFGQVRWTEIWKSTDSGASWTHTGVKFPGDKDGGGFQLITWGLGNDGYVYLFSTGFQRDKGLRLYRVPSNAIGDAAAYQPWGFNGSWAWGNPSTEVLGGKFGEMCLRPIAGKWVLTWFNAADYRIDAMVLNTPTDNLYTAPKTTLIYGGAWGAEDATHVAQLYGGYIVPGSTLSDLHLIVSQWNTGTNDVYHAMQFRVRGLA